jgi:hypothetical protein
MLCGKALLYGANPVKVKCSHCGSPGEAYITCPNGHYVCDPCHSRLAREKIERLVFSTSFKDPQEIAEAAFENPSLPMLGCEHAYIAGGALMAALKNINRASDDDIKEVFARTQKQAHGGYCGLTGVCGIVPATGAVFAVLTGSKCGTDKEQKITMETVTEVSMAIAALTGPSCCKAYVMAALEAAKALLMENLGVELPSKAPFRCAHSSRHPHWCREKLCPYFPV